MKLEIEIDENALAGAVKREMERMVLGSYPDQEFSKLVRRVASEHVSGIGVSAHVSAMAQDVFESVIRDELTDAFRKSVRKAIKEMNLDAAGRESVQRECERRFRPMFVGQPEQEKKNAEQNPQGT